MLEDDVDAVTMSWIIRAIYQMVDSCENTPIHIIINTYGGGAYQMFALYDAIRQSPCEVITYGIGAVMSAGTMLFLAGDRRVVYPNTTFMFHSIASGTAGKLFEMKIDETETERVWDRCLNIYADRTNQSAKWWKKKLEFKDWFYDIEDLKEFNIATDELPENKLFLD